MSKAPWGPPPPRIHVLAAHVWLDPVTGYVLCTMTKDGTVAGTFALDWTGEMEVWEMATARGLIPPPPVRPAPSLLRRKPPAKPLATSGRGTTRKRKR
jgi:hypothetical protein